MYSARKKNYITHAYYMYKIFQNINFLFCFNDLISLNYLTNAWNNPFYYPS